MEPDIIHFYRIYRACSCWRLTLGDVSHERKHDVIDMAYETPRLILRSPKEEDFEPFAELNADADVMKFFPNTLTPENARIAFDKIQEFWQKHGFGAFSVEEKSSGKWIGFVGFNIPSFMPNSVEMVWRLKKEFWEKGMQPKLQKNVLR